MARITCCGVGSRYGFLFSDSDLLMCGIDYSAIRTAVPLQMVLDLLGFVPICRRADQVRGPCPIHGSNSLQSRSFSANLARNAFRCFTCGAAGNQLDLWSITQSMSLFDAATDLCNRLLIPIPRNRATKRASPHLAATREEEPVSQKPPGKPSHPLDRTKNHRRDSPPRPLHSSCVRSASEIIVKPFTASVSCPISMLSTISATAGRPCGRTRIGYAWMMFTSACSSAVQMCRSA